MYEKEVRTRLHFQPTMIHVSHSLVALMALRMSAKEESVELGREYRRVATAPPALRAGSRRRSNSVPAGR